MSTLLQQELTKAKKRQPKLKGLVKALESGYMKDEGGRLKRKRTFSPSTLVWGNGKCPRYWWYAFHETWHESDITPFSKANMGSGTDAHMRIEKAALDSGVMLEDEVEIHHDDPPIFGYADGIVEWENITYVAEIKTMKDEAWSYRRVSGKPASYHVEQLLYYMKARDAYHGLLIYENKNTHEIQVFPITMTPENEEWIQQSFRWLRLVYKAYEDDTFVCKPYKRLNAKICKGCPVKETCFSDSEGVLKLPVLESLPK